MAAADMGEVDQRLHNTRDTMGACSDSTCSAISRASGWSGLFAQVLAPEQANAGYRVADFVGYAGRPAGQSTRAAPECISSSSSMRVSSVLIFDQAATRPLEALLPGPRPIAALVQVESHWGMAVADQLFACGRWAA